MCLVLRGLFYAAALPLWEGYDEYSHFAYLQHLARYNTIPVPGKSRISREVAASLSSTPLPWTLRDAPGAISYDRFWTMSRESRDARLAALRPRPESGRDEDPAAEVIYESQQPFLYYGLMAPVLALSNSLSLPTWVFLLRCASILLCSLAVPFGFAIARRVLGNDYLAVGAVAIAVSMPEALINFSRVGNEGLALVLYTILAYLCLEMLDRGPALGRSVLMGVTLGCGLLTKAYFLTAIPAVCFVFALALRSKAASWRRAGVHLAATLGIAILLSFWWYRFIYRTTGDLTGQIQSASVRGVPWLDRVRVAFELDWLRALDTALISHLWFGAWSFLQVRSWMYHLLYGLLLAALIGIVVAVFRSQARRALLALVAFEACLCGSLAYHAVVSQLGYNQPTTNGWYLYCLVFAEVTLLCAGLMALLPCRLRVWTPFVVAALFALLDIYGLNFVQMPYYLGLTGHTAGGRLPAFHIGQVWTVGWEEISARLMTNRPYLGTPAVFCVLWVLYLCATVACPIMAFRCAQAASRREPRPWAG